MSVIADKFKRAARRLVVMRVPELEASVVYQVRRATALELAKHGEGDIPGLQEAALVLQEAEQEWDEQVRIADCQDEEQRAATMAAIDASRRTVAERILSDLSKPENLGPAMVRVNATLCASVEAAGIALPGVEDGVLPASTEPRAVCEEITPGRWLEPLRFVQGAAGDGEVSLLDLSEFVRVLLFSHIARAFFVEAAESLKPFRGRPGAPGGGGPVGPTVQAASAPDPVR